MMMMMVVVIMMMVIMMMMMMKIVFFWFINMEKSSDSSNDRFNQHQNCSLFEISYTCHLLTRYCPINIFDNQVDTSMPMHLCQSL
jgi:hypothetical protein